MSSALFLSKPLWKQQCANGNFILNHHGVDIGAGEKFDNILYADDLLVYAQAVDDLVQMIELLMVELGNMGLQ